MMDEKKRKQRMFLGLVVFLVVFYLFVMLTGRETPEERISRLVRRHWGAVVFVRTNTEQDREIQEFLDEVRSRIRGSAAIVAIRQEEAAFLGAETQANAPALVVIEAHGMEMSRFHGKLSENDKRILEENINRIAWHQSVTSSGRYEEQAATTAPPEYYP